MEFLPIEELRAQAEAEEIRRQKMKAEIEKKKQYLQEVRHLRAEAVNNGDMATYEKLQNEPEQSKVELKAMEIEYERLGVNRDEFLASWNHYIRIRNNAFNKKVEAYKQARQALCLQFLELAELQADALRDAAAVTRTLTTNENARYWSNSMCVDFVDGMDRPACMDEDKQRVFFNNRRSYPDVAMFIESGELPDGGDLNTAYNLNRVLVYRNTMSTEDMQKIKERTLAKMDARKK